MNWDTFDKKERPECRECPRFEGKYVPPVVRKEARLLVVVEAPGRDEAKDANPRPLIGAAGRMANAIFRHAGINRDEISITNTCLCYEEGNPKPSPLEIKCCAGLVETVIDQMPGLRVILAMGGVPTARLVGARPITTWRGSVMPRPKRVVVGEERVMGPDRFGPKAKKAGQLKPHLVDIEVEQPEGAMVVLANHPAELLHGQISGFPLAVAHARRARYLAEGKQLIKVGMNLWPNAPIAHAANMLSAQDRITLDLETDGIGGRPTVVGLATDKDHAATFTPNEELVGILRKALLDQKRVLIGQNIGYDIGVMRKWWKIDYQGPRWDTMHGAHFQRPDFSGIKETDKEEGEKSGKRRAKDLALIASRMSGFQHYNWKAEFRDGRRDIHTYCALDCAWAAAIELVQREDFGRTGRLRLFEDMLMPLLPVLEKMENEGTLVDVEVREELWKRQNGILEGLNQEWEKLVPGVEWTSSKQLHEYFYWNLGLDPVMIIDKYGQERPTLNKEAIEILSEKYPEVKELQVLVDIRHIAKMKGTYLEQELDQENRFHPYFDPSGTTTGRLSSDFQQLPKPGEACKRHIRGCVCVEIREMFIHDKGDECLAVGDYSQIENRLTARLSGEKWLEEAFDRVGFDQHQETATALGVDRDKGKKANHLSNYLGGARKLAKELGCTVGEAKIFMDRYAMKYPRITAKRKEWIAKVQKDGWIANPFGRRMYFHVGRDGVIDGPAVVAFMPQSTAADMMLHRLIDLAKGGYKLRWSVHDEIGISLEDDYPPHDLCVIKEIMETPFRQLNNWGCPVDLKTGRSWADAKR